MVPSTASHPSIKRPSSAVFHNGIGKRVEDLKTIDGHGNLFKTIVGPVSLIGGTAAIYKSLLDHPSSTLTPLSLLFMMLLAIQYAIQPRLSKKLISPEVNKQSVALVEEVVKTSMAAAIFISKPTDIVTAAVKDWSLASSLTVAGLPAVIYAFQGVFQYVSQQHLDPVTFNGLTQTKTLSAALCCWLVLGKIQSPVQILALGILFASALVFQGYLGVNFISKPIESKDKAKNDWFIFGVVPCLGAAFLSGLAGALSQKGLQMTGIYGRDPFLYTMEVSFFSAVTLLVNLVQTQKSYANFTKGWTWKTLIPIVMKAAGGVITALVHKYAGSVAKGFALMFGLVLSGVVQLVSSNESLQPHQVAGTLMILLSTWLHFTHPPTRL